MQCEIEEFFPKFIGKYRYDGDQQVVKDVCDRVLKEIPDGHDEWNTNCLLYTSPSPRDRTRSRMPSSA